MKNLEDPQFKESFVTHPHFLEEPTDSEFVGSKIKVNLVNAICRNMIQYADMRYSDVICSKCTKSCIMSCTRNIETNSYDMNMIMCSCFLHDFLLDVCTFLG